MRGLDEQLSIGQRMAWYRRRRGMSQDVLAGLVGRTVDWLSKVENGRAQLDRLSVLRQLADALDISLGDLIGSPLLMDWNADTKQRTVPTLRKAVLSYTSLTPSLAPVRVDGADDPDLPRLPHDVNDLWTTYQDSRFGYVVTRLPGVLARAHAAAERLSGTEQETAYAHLALTYHAAATTLTKLGEVDLAWICSDRGLDAARRSDNPVVLGSLLRSVAHSLLSNGQYEDASQVTGRAVDDLAGGLKGASGAYLSVFGSLFLVGAMAAARSDDAREARSQLAHAGSVASRLGRDGNHMWTAFGPINVAIHQVSIAMEVGDVQVAADLGPRVDATPLPVERRVRHALEVARAHTARNKPADGLGVLLAAERDAPEQVRYHYLSRQLVIDWVRRSRAKPAPELRQLATRLHVV